MNVPNTTTGLEQERDFQPELPDIMFKWISPPTGNSTCPYTSFKHAKFYQEFRGNPEIRQVRTGAGKSRGKRLFWLPDIFNELHRRAQEQNNNK